MKKQCLLLMMFWLVTAECMERSISVEDFHQALLDDKKEILQSWIVMAKSGKMDVNTRDKEGRAALMFAAYYGKEEVVRDLIKVPGIDVNAKDEEGRTVLIWAAYHWNVETIRELLKVPGIDVNAKNKDGRLALYLAIENLREQNALLLWAVGAEEVGLPALTSQMQKVKEEGKAIFKGILSALNFENVKELQGYADRGFSLMIKDLQGNNPLHIAVNCNHPSHAQYLIGYNKQWLREKNKNGLSPLDLIYGHWDDENEQWNAFIAELPGDFTLNVEKAKKGWQMFKEKAFKEGYEGMPGLPSEKEK